MQVSDQREWINERLSAWRATGNPEVLGQLIKWQRDRAYATALRILGNREDAEDAVQQACIKLMSRTHGFDTPEQFNVTVYRAVVQCALDMARANRVRTNLEKAMSPFEDNHSPIPQLAAEQAEALCLVWQELNTMPEDSRALVVLCYQEGLSLTDAAQVLAVPRETLRDRLSSVMADLRKKLSQRGVMLSLLALVGLIRHGSAEAAPASLCEALDHAISGPGCGEIPAAQAPASADSSVLESAQTTTSSTSLPHGYSMGLGIAASLLVAAGVWFAFHQTESPPTNPAQASLNQNQFGDTNNAQTKANRVAEQPNAANELNGKTPAAAPAPLAIAQPNAAQRNAKENKEKQDEPLALEKVPAAVREAAQGAVAGVRLKSAEVNREEKAERYEFKGEANGKTYEIIVSKDGKILSVKLDDDDNQNPDQQPVKPPKADF